MRHREVPDIGQRLRDRREELELTIRDAAQELHVDQWMLEALEANDFAALGAPVFAKGHLRKYAQLLELPADDLLVGYYQNKDAPKMPPLVADMFRRSPRNHLDWLLPALAVLGVVLLVGLMIVWLQGRGSTPDASAGADAEAAQDEPAASVPASVPVTRADDERIALPLPLGGDAVADDAADAQADSGAPAVVPDAQPQLQAPAPQVSVTEREPEPAPIRAAAQVRLQLEFSGESWVEAYDAERRRLIFGLGRAGRTRSVTGTPPVELTLGNASVVALRVDGKPYEVPRTAIRGDVARLRIGDAPDR